MSKPAPSITSWPTPLATATASASSAISPTSSTRDLAAPPFGVLKVQSLLGEQCEQARELLLSFGDECRFFRRVFLLLLLRGPRRLGRLTRVLLGLRLKAAKWFDHPGVCHCSPPIATECPIRRPGNMCEPGELNAAGPDRVGQKASPARGERGPSTLSHHVIRKHYLF